QPLAAANVVEEVAEDTAAVRRVVDFRVELQAEHRPAAMANRRDRAGFGPGQRHEIAVDQLYLIAVAHPHDGLFGHAGEEAVRLLNVAMGPAVLPAARGRQYL